MCTYCVPGTVTDTVGMAASRTDTGSALTELLTYSLMEETDHKHVNRCTKTRSHDGQYSEAKKAEEWESNWHSLVRLRSLSKEDPTEQ